MVLEHQGQHASQWAAICSIAAKIGCSGKPCGTGCVHERDAGLRDGMRSEMRDPLKALGGRTGAAANKREPAQGLGLFCPGGARPQVQAMIAFIDEHRAFTGSSRSAGLPIAPSTYHGHAARRADPD